MFTSEDHEAVPPQFSEDPTAAELPDPAHFVWLLGGLLAQILDPLKTHIEPTKKTLEDGRSFKCANKTLQRTGKPTFHCT